MRKCLLTGLVMLRKCVFLEHQHTVPKSENNQTGLFNLKLLIYYRSNCGGTAQPVRAVMEIVLPFFFFSGRLASSQR